MIETPVVPLALAATAGVNLGLAAMVGILVSYGCLARQPGIWARHAARRLRRLLPIGFALTASCLVATLWFETAAMGEISVSAASASVPLVLSSTHYGHAWLIGAGALVVAGAAARRQRSGAWPDTARVLFGVALVLFASGRAVIGHAAARGDGSVWVAIEAVHLLSISLWTGQVIVAGWVVLTDWADATRDDVRARGVYVAALSRSATWALSAVVITGVLNVLRGFGSPAEITSTAYGQILIAKLALTGGAVALGAFNRFRVMPALLREPHSGSSAEASRCVSRFVRILRFESLVLGAVVVIAAWLGATPPPG